MSDPPVLIEYAWDRLSGTAWIHIDNWTSPRADFRSLMSHPHKTIIAMVDLQELILLLEHHRVLVHAVHPTFLYKIRYVNRDAHVEILKLLEKYHECWRWFVEEPIDLLDDYAEHHRDSNRFHQLFGF